MTPFGIYARDKHANKTSLHNIINLRGAYSTMLADREYPILHALMCNTELKMTLQKLWPALKMHGFRHT